MRAHRNPLQHGQELADVNGQLKDLQGLFDEVNHQLQHECGRIERLQGSVTQCAKQAKELLSFAAGVEGRGRGSGEKRCFAVVMPKACGVSPMESSDLTLVTHPRVRINSLLLVAGR